MAAEEVSISSSWSWEDNQAFEMAIADFSEDSVDQWEKIAVTVPGKTMEDIKQHYEILLDDIKAIESGRVPMPNYISSPDGSAGHSGRKGGSSHGESGNGGRASRAADQERKKGISWTEDEHRLFLLGLEKFGKGDWRSISRNFVISRTPTQVASHAQKYFNRLNSVNKDRRRTSIHDITTVGNGDISTPQGPITGQVNGQLVVPTGKSVKQSSQFPPGTPVIGLYGNGTTIGQPVGGPLVPAVGTPVNLPVPTMPHMAYGMRAPVVGTMVNGAPMNLVPMSYPMHRTSSAQR